jgi:hypothetical protein
MSSTLKVTEGEEVTICEKCGVEVSEEEVVLPIEGRIDDFEIVCLKCNENRVRRLMETNLFMFLQLNCPLYELEEVYESG